MNTDVDRELREAGRRYRQRALPTAQVDPDRLTEPATEPGRGRRVVGLAAAAVVALAAVGATVLEHAARHDPASVTSTDAVAGTWNLRSVHGSTAVELTRNGGAYVTIDRAGHYSGSDGCNALSGTVRLAYGSLRLTPLATYHVECGTIPADAAAAVDQVMTRTGIVQWRRLGTQLSLTRGGVTLALDSSTAADPAWLADTAWFLRGAASPTGPVDLPANRPLILRFIGATQMNYSDSCNSEWADATLTRGHLDASGAGGTTAACLRGTGLIGVIHAVLDRGVADWSLTAATLTITRGGYTLTYEAPLPNPQYSKPSPTVVTPPSHHDPEQRPSGSVSRSGR